VGVGVKRGKGGGVLGPPVELPLYYYGAVYKFLSENSRIVEKIMIIEMLNINSLPAKRCFEATIKAKLMLHFPASS